MQEKHRTVASRMPPTGDLAPNPAILPRVICTHSFNMSAHYTQVLILPMYNAHPCFSLKNLGKTLCIIHGKIQYVPRPPDQELNLQPSVCRTMPNPLNHTSQGWFDIFDNKNTWRRKFNNAHCLLSAKM